MTTHMPELTLSTQTGTMNLATITELRKVCLKLRVGSDNICLESGRLKVYAANG
jgi:hypothetical protein